jgi:ribosomal protein L11 methyltransferase
MTTHLIRFSPVSHARSMELIGHLENMLDFERVTVASHEIADDEWAVEVYAGDGTTLDDLSAMVAEAVSGQDAPTFHAATLDETDWVQKSLEGLAPVQAGRIFVHGSHDRHRIPTNAVSIEIEAALAFGTGHHGTTLGCLLAFNELIKLTKPRRILDVGTGTGVLGIAAALTLKTPVIAGDIDPVSVATAKANARFNNAAGLFHVVKACGLDHPAIGGGGPYDLIFANILAAPLVILSPDVARAAATGGFIILSGLLKHQIRQVSAAYKNRGFVMVHSRIIEGWAALTLQKVRG